ncbi:hypothetical protein DNK47_03165 [Mycoplasma wenyonii]|uniref:Uncharacterized protein n=1 Tax=Mycoplasma wenyonii TaxID=65123 RepID=A0A328PUK9_9MOLU|nr:hypothetical protein [Mycoplasma wenyonii]RAO94789.1 hypothetical protein DNK47_03165 [Mycoplasma wenyonii]
MTGIVSKFALSVFVAGAGGTAIGIPLSSSSKSNSHNAVTLIAKSQDTQQSPVVAELQAPSLPQPTNDVGIVDSHDTSHLGATEADLPSEHPLETEAVHQEDSNLLVEETLQADEPEGNCTVIVTPETLQKLPTSSVPYMSVHCWNSVEGDSMLRLWKGFFPTSLLKEEAIKLEQGTKFKLDVQEIEIPNDDDYDTELFEHVFTSEQFLKTPVTGRWGNTFVERTTEDEIPIYEVNLSKSGISDKFYIFPE